MGGVADQFRSISVYLVQMLAIWRNPVIAWAAANGSIDRPEGAISRNLPARRILRDADLGAVDAVAANVAVTEVRSEHRSVIRGDGQPAQFRGLACARVERHERADADPPVCIDAAHDDPVAGSYSVDEGIRPTVQEGYVERRGASRVVERGCAEPGGPVHREYDEAVRGSLLLQDHRQRAL